MARPKSEDKKQALLEAATAAFAQSGIAASTALIARNAGVAEGTLFRYFATKDDLLNALYLHHPRVNRPAAAIRFAGRSTSTSAGDENPPARDG